MSNHDRKLGLRRDQWASVLGIVLVIIAVALLGYNNSRIEDQDATIKTDTAEINDILTKLGTSHTQLVEGCKRLQIVRIEDNRSQYSQWKVDKLFLSAIQHPAQAQPQNKRSRELTKRFLGVAQDAVSTLAWVPRTNCEVAVALHGSLYRPPEPVPFSRQLPPDDAITLGRDLFK